MSADKFLDQLKTILATIVDWTRVIAGLIFGLLFVATAASMAGHPIPYIPAIRANMQEVGIIMAAVGYSLWRR